MYTETIYLADPFNQIYISGWEKLHQTIETTFRWDDGDRRQLEFYHGVAK
jgi:hypothetical protein